MLFFFNDTATTEIYTLSLHDALPIWLETATAMEDTVLKQVPCGRFLERLAKDSLLEGFIKYLTVRVADQQEVRSEEHTSELQSHVNLVCRLLLEKKKKR